MTQTMLMLAVIIILVIVVVLLVDKVNDLKKSLREKGKRIEEALEKERQSFQKNKQLQTKVATLLGMFSYLGHNPLACLYIVKDGLPFKESIRLTIDKETKDYKAFLPFSKEELTDSIQLRIGETSASDLKTVDIKNIEDILTKYIK